MIFQNHRQIPVIAFKVRSPLQSLKRGLLEGSLELVSDLIKHVKSSYYNITTVSYSKVMKTISAHTKSTDLVFKKDASFDTIRR
jgi:hypothetical protein